MSEVFSGLPPSLRIGPYDIKVTVKDIPLDDDGNTTFGLYSTVKLSIELHQDVPHPLHAADTFLHEILHGLYGHAGLGAMSSEEQVCTALATGLVQVFRDNPEALKWLTKAVA